MSRLEEPMYSEDKSDIVPTSVVAHLDSEHTNYLIVSHVVFRRSRSGTDTLPVQDENLVRAENEDKLTGYLIYLIASVSGLQLKPVSKGH